MKPKTQFRCQQCGEIFARWSGQCVACKNWNGLTEEDRPHAQGGAHRREAPGTIQRGVPTSLTAVSFEDETRLQSGFQEFDRVLGGGVMPASIVLLGGDPGIGKTTLLLQVLPCLTTRPGGLLYISGEESLQQIKQRAKRLHIQEDRVTLLGETNLEHMLEVMRAKKPDVVVVDSIQTSYTNTLTSLPGGISQVQEVASQLMIYAKQHQTTVFIIGHVTKQGSVAGPKTLEHLVDTVLLFEGDPHRAYRMLRTMKNRFGPTHEVGIWTMQGQGLQEVENPSECFLQNRHAQSSGSAITAAVEGTRPLLLEVQALVAPSPLSNPRRTVTGVDSNRLALLLAVLEKREGVMLHDQDVYANLVGGLNLDEPALDLALSAAIMSSLRDKPLSAGTLVLGEIGLGGEVRAVPNLDLRLLEADRLGYQRAVVPHQMLPDETRTLRMEVIPVSTVHEGLNALF